MLLVKIITKKRLIAFSIAFILALSAANLVFTLVVGSATSLDLVLRGGQSDGVVVVERSARTIYTSHIPASLAISLGKLPSVNAEPFIATVGYVSNDILITRGVQSTAKLNAVLLSGSLPSGEGSWIILGERAAHRLGKQIGETVALASSLRKTVLLLSVVAVCRFDNLMNDEAIVHEKTARQLTGLPQGMISAIIVHGTNRETIEKLLGRTYRLKIKCASNVLGNLVVLEANGAPIRSLKADTKLEETLDLPFGYYTITFQTQNLVTTLGEVLLDSEKSFDGSVRIEENLVLKVPGPSKPVLRKSDGVEVQPIQQGEFWVFRTSPGVHRLEIGKEVYSLPLFSSATFDPASLAGQMHTIRVSVAWSDGSEASNYNLIIRTAEGEIVLSRLAVGSETDIDLPKGNYTVEAYSVPYSVSTMLSVPTVNEARLVLPSIQWNIEKIPFQYYTLIKAMPVEQMASFTLASISGISATLLTGLSFSMTTLLAALTINIQNYLYVSAKERLALIRALGASRRFILGKIAFPGLVLNLSLAAVATIASYALSNMSVLSQLTLFGHSIAANISNMVLFSFSLAGIVWLFGTAKLMRTLAQL